MKVGDLVKTVDDQFEAESEFHTDFGIIVEKHGSQVWVRWISDNLLAWMPKQNLEVVSESR